MVDDVRYYRVSPRFWSVTHAWSEPARHLALYLLTCPHRTVEGLFRLPKAYIQADLGWSPQRLAEPFEELLDDGFIEYDDNSQVVLLVKALKYQAPANPNGVTAALRQLEEVPESPLDTRFHALAERYCERLVERLPERFGQPPAPTPAPAPTPKPLASSSEDAERVDDQFHTDFWPAYPPTNGRKPEKAKALQQWRKLTAVQRQRAIVGAHHLAASDHIPKYAHRFLRRDTAGEFPFDDWQTPARPSAAGVPRHVREHDTYDRMLSDVQRQLEAQT